MPISPKKLFDSKINIILDHLPDSPGPFNTFGLSLELWLSVNNTTGFSFPQLGRKKCSNQSSICYLSIYPTICKMYLNDLYKRTQLLTFFL